MRLRRCFVSLLLVVAAARAADAPAGDAAPPDPDRAAVESLRQDLAASRFERVLAGATVLLQRTDLSEAARVDILALEAQAQAASGDFDAAEAAWATLLALRPGFVPDPAGTPRKGLLRFEKLKASKVGTLRFQVDPPDAKVLVDGREAHAGADGLLPVAAGERAVRVERRGYDPLESKVQVPGGQTVPVLAQLVPNARSVLVRAEPDGVEVLVDGNPVGVTRRPGGDGAPSSAASELLVEYLSLGEHVFRLRKPCFHAQSFTQLLKVDLVDRSPKALDVVTLDPARSKLVPRGAPAGAELRVDGGGSTPLPADSVDVCPGTRDVEVRAGGRVVRRARVEVPEGQDAVVDLAPRPQVVLAGATTWPPGFEAWSAMFDLAGTVALPKTDPARAASWEGDVVPPGVDLVLAVASPAADETVPRLYLVSPALRTVDRVATAPSPHAPSLRRSASGIKLADSRIGGNAVVVRVSPGSPAAAAGLKPGERIVAVAGVFVHDARSASAALAAEPPGRPVEVRVASRAGAERAVPLTPASSPWVESVDDAAPGRAAVASAWFEVLAAAGGDDAPAAWGSLGLALARAGRAAAAADAWARAKFPDRAGIGAATAAFYRGASLVAAGREAEAREPLERARASQATAVWDDGPSVAPAAADRLRDLGVPAPGVTSR